MIHKQLFSNLFILYLALSLNVIKIRVFNATDLNVQNY